MATKAQKEIQANLEQLKRDLLKVLDSASPSSKILVTVSFDHLIARAGCVKMNLKDKKIVECLQACIQAAMDLEAALRP